MGVCGASALPMACWAEKRPDADLPRFDFQKGREARDGAFGRLSAKSQVSPLTWLLVKSGSGPESRRLVRARKFFLPLCNPMSEKQGIRSWEKHGQRRAFFSKNALKTGKHARILFKARNTES